MEHSNLVYVLDGLMRESYFQCQWAVRWQEEYNAVTIILQFDLSNPRTFRLKDSYGRLVNAEQFTYETSVLLYDPKKLEVVGGHHLVTVSVNSESGIPYGECVVLVKYLKQLTAVVRPQWTGFLSDDTMESFSLNWDTPTYERLRQRLVESHRYSNKAVFLPSSMVKE